MVSCAFKFIFSNLSLHVCVHVCLCMQGPRETRGGHWSLELLLQTARNSHHGCRELNLRPPEGQQVFLTTKPAPYPFLSLSVWPVSDFVFSCGDASSFPSKGSDEHQSLLGEYDQNTPDFCLKMDSLSEIISHSSNCCKWVSPRSSFLPFLISPYSS